MLRIAMIAGDERETHGRYHETVPSFGPAPAALIDGLAKVGSVELHVISCLRKPAKSPCELAPNFYFPSVRVPSWGFMKTLYAPAILGVRRLLRKIRPAVVHGQGTE